MSEMASNDGARPRLDDTGSCFVIELNVESAQMKS